ncbi:MAG: beta strand repeat-containing protein [Pirellulales bacterium]
MMRPTKIFRSAQAKRGAHTRSRFAPTLEPLEARALLAVDFTPGNLAVIRIGDGADPLLFEATEAFIDEYTPGGTLVQSIPFDTAGAERFGLTGGGFTDGGLTRTDDGQYLVAAGYRSSPGDANPASANAAVTPRVVARIGTDGDIDATTQLTDSYSTITFRGVTSDDGTRFWLSGSSGSMANPTGGVRYVGGFGGSQTSVDIGEQVFDNMREILVLDGNLYTASGAGTPGHAVYQIGSGLPTSGPQPYNEIIPESPPLLEQFNAFFLADLDPAVAGFDTLYAVDSNSGVSSIDKWSKVGSTWTQNGAGIATPGGFQSAFGLTGYVQGNTVNLYMTTTSSGGAAPSTIFALTDTSGYNAANNGSLTTPIVTASVDTVFKNIALVPSLAAAVTTSGGSASYTENAAASTVDGGLTVADTDSADLYSAKVAITGNFDPTQDVLSFTPSGGITGSYSAITGELKLWGTATPAQYQTVLQSVKYQNTSDNPTTATRTISFSVRDNADVKSNVATRNVTLTAVNDAPALSVPGAQIVGLNHDLTFSSVNGNLISISDVDVQSGNMTLTMSVPVGQGTLTLATLAGLTGSGDGTNSISYSGTLAALNTALNGLVYHSPASPQGVSLSVGIDDQGNTGTGGAQSDSDSVSITVTNIANSPPVVTTTVAALAYTENATLAVDNGLTVTDSDHANLVGATVAVTSNYVVGQDVLAFTNQLGITGSFDAPSGVLTLTGSSSKANYQTALRSVTYNNTSDLPSTLARVVTFRASDGVDLSSPATRTINITSVNDAPVNTAPGQQSFAKNTTRVFGATGGNQISFSDVDSGGNNEQITLTSANGTITLATLTGLSGSGNGTGSLTYSGSIANLNTALNGLTFTPTLNFTGATSIVFTSNDLGNTGTPGAQSTVSNIPIQINNPVALVINEIVQRAPVANATSQYIELRNTSNTTYAIPAGTYLVGIEGHDAFNTGEIHDVFDLAGASMSTGTNGHLVILPSSNLYTTPTDVTDPNANVYEQGPISPGFGNISAGLPSTVGHYGSGTFTSLESANPITFFLVSAPSAPVPGQDIDANDDGLPDGSVYNNWTIADSVGVGNFLSASNDFLYGAINFLDPTGSAVALNGVNVSTNFTPAWVGRSGDTTGSTADDWVAARLTGSSPTWALNIDKTSRPGFGGLALDHIGASNFTGIQQKPVADLNGSLDGRNSVASFVYGDPAINVFSTTAAVTDVDSPNLSSIVITITNLLDGTGEGLSATTTGTSITAMYSSGTLTLSGVDTLANYQQVLRTVKYDNTDGTPVLTTRELTVVANDGANTSLTSTAQVGLFTKTHKVRLNEIDANPPGTDNPYEYVELKGFDGGSSLANMYLVAFQGHWVFDVNSPDFGQVGTAEFVVPLGASSLGANGMLIVKSPTGGFTPPGATTVITDAQLDTLTGGLENGSNSFYLIYSPNGAIVEGTDYDANNDGKLDSNLFPAGIEVVDSIAWRDRNFENDISYGTNQLVQFNNSPEGATRFRTDQNQKSSAWYNGALVATGQDPAQLSYDAANASANFPTGGVLTPGDENFPSSSSVVARRIFYNQSAFDGNNASITVADDGAIAPDKTAYLPGDGLAGFQHITSYSRGINGIMVDMSSNTSHTAITANDFVFKVGANNSPNTWTIAPAPSAISVRTGAGLSGADRVEITWAAGVIKNQWLMVATKATANTALTATGTVATPGGPVSVGDIFFFGNRIGDTGSPTATSFTTTTADASTIIAGGLGAAGGITNVRDIDKSNTITVAGDRAATLGNIGALNRLTVGTAGPFAPEDGDAGISSALAAAVAPAPAVALPPGIARRLQSGDVNANRIAAYFRQLAESDSGRFGKLAAQADLIDNTLELDEELVGSLAGGL